MDNRFPAQLFPHFYLDGPPDKQWIHDYGGWGSYEKIMQTKPAQCTDGEQRQWEFQSQRVAEMEIWTPLEPVVTPIMAPNKTKIFAGPPLHPENFADHMQYFYVHHGMDNFSTMGKLMGEHFSFKKPFKKGCVKMGRMNRFIENLKYKKCELIHAWEHVHRYRNLLEEVVSDIPCTLLAELLHEELTLQSKLEQFQPYTTGGALGYVHLHGFDVSKEACLIYPRNKALNELNFHTVVLEFSEGQPPKMNMDYKPLEMNLNGTVRQISVATLYDEIFIGVRSDHYCSAWTITNGVRPKPTEVVQLKKRCTSLNVSPHLPGELVIASECGAAYLWTVEKQLQKIRNEKTNLYFNAKSTWRWCEFSAHPRVMVYADRTGAELTDMRSSNSSHTLFRIGKTSGCRSGERVFLAKYLGQAHAHHHLITTQFSAYILDERMPNIPALKWEHMMHSPPCFAEVLPALDSHSTSKIVLGAQKTQETMLLQYSGGCAGPCQSHGPVQKLCSPRESLKIRQLPHRQHKAEERLAVPAAGLAAVQYDDYLYVLQLTEAGDLFSQTLKLYSDTTSSCPDTFECQNMAFNPSSSPAQTSVEERKISEVDLSNDLNTNSSEEEEIKHEFICVPQSSAVSAAVGRAHLERPAIPETASKELKVIWKDWLSLLLMKTKAKKHSLEHRQKNTVDFIQFRLQHWDKLKEDKVQSLRKDLTNIMTNGRLVTHGGTYLPPLAVTAVPDVVDPSNWPDDLSQRLTASWEDGWKNWWEEKLGLNRDSKIMALRRKRIQAKRAKAQNRVALSGSFTSSVNYQDDLSGWSSATSQYLGSDSESYVGSQSAVVDNELSGHETVPMSPVPRDSAFPVKGSATPLRMSPHTSKAGQQDSALSDSQSQNQQQLEQGSSVETDSLFSPLKTILKTSNTSQQKPSLQQQQEYLNSLFSSQEPSLDNTETEDGTLSVFLGAAMSQRSSNLLALRRPAQHRASSQASQPQRKKPRMGF